MIKNEIAMQKDIFRLAAALYSENTDSFSETQAQLEIIKCIFVRMGNDYLSCSEIAANILDTYKYHLSEDEIEQIIRRSNNTFMKATLDESDVYKLTEKEHKESMLVQENNIDSFIDAFIGEKKILDAETFKSAIHLYLYELTTTNINTYRTLLSGKNGAQFSNADLSVDLEGVSDEERQYIHDFLVWDNPKKNEALGNLVFCCLEYCLLISGDSPNSIVEKLIRQRDVYLDTNIIFRALGINGEGRMKVMHAFLGKCKQAKVRLIISGVTKKEFFDTIAYYVSQIIRYPRGQLYTDAYEQICDYNIFSFYEKWKEGHQSLSLKYFNTYIEGLYDSLIKKYDIVDNERIPDRIYTSEEFIKARDGYAASINAVKQTVRDYYLTEDYSGTARYRHDAIIIRYIEIQKENCAKNKDIFLVSSDKLLRMWDMNRSSVKYPIVIYPSQLFLILLKTCGRSKDDFESFVSFINIRPKSKQISPEKANIILSGISSITDDIIKQREIVDAIFEGELQDVIKRSKNDDALYVSMQTESKKYLEKALREKESQITELTRSAQETENDNRQLHSKAKKSQEELNRMRQEKKKKEEKLKEQEKQLYNLAEKHIMPKYVFRCMVVPAILLLCCLAFVLFVLLQFIFVDQDWNCVVTLFNWIKGTYFGKNVGDFVYFIDAAIGAVLLFCLKRWMINPFNKNSTNSIKQKMISKFVDSVQNKE